MKPAPNGWDCSDKCVRVYRCYMCNAIIQAFNIEAIAMHHKGEDRFMCGYEHALEHIKFLQERGY